MSLAPHKASSVTISEAWVLCTVPSNRLIVFLKPFGTFHQYIIIEYIRGPPVVTLFDQTLIPNRMCRRV